MGGDSFKETYASNFASSEIFALSKREIGQPAFAPFAMAVNFSPSILGIFAVMSKCDSVTVKPASVFFHRDGRGRVDGSRREASLAEFRRERHRETARVRRRDEFFGIRADAVLKACAERVLRFLERAALGGDVALARFQVAGPDRGCFAFHKFFFQKPSGNSPSVQEANTTYHNLKRT